MVLGRPAFAQAPVTASASLQIVQPAPDLATAQAYTYRHYDDGSTTGTPFARVTCTGTASPFTCTLPFPAFTPGAHTMVLTTGNAAGESSPYPTPALSFTFSVIPAPAISVTIVPAAK